MNKKSIVVWLFAFCLSLPVLATGLVGKVVSVADGDTVTVLDADRVQHKIRLSGIDAPERAQAFGKRSREYLASMVAGQQVAVETDKTDRFGRSIGKVLLQGRDINLAIPCWFGVVRLQRHAQRSPIVGEHGGRRAHARVHPPTPHRSIRGRTLEVAPP